MPLDLPDRSPDADGRRQRGGFAYFGTFDVNVDEGYVVHQVVGSPMAPQWVGRGTRALLRVLRQPPQLVAEERPGSHHGHADLAPSGIAGPNTTGAHRGQTRMCRPLDRADRVAVRVVRAVRDPSRTQLAAVARTDDDGGRSRRPGTARDMEHDGERGLADHDSGPGLVVPHRVGRYRVRDIGRGGRRLCPAAGRVVPA